jgi:hypothetical protein
LGAPHYRARVRFIRSKLFEDSFTRLRETDLDLSERAGTDIMYLVQEKHEAVLPQVRWRIAQSKFADIMGEIRTHRPGDDAFIRTLFVMPADESVCALLVMGDKNSGEENAATGNDWYDKAVPIADAIWEAIVASGEAGPKKA